MMGVMPLSGFEAALHGDLAARSSSARNV